MVALGSCMLFNTGTRVPADIEVAAPAFECMHARLSLVRASRHRNCLPADSGVAATAFKCMCVQPLTSTP